MPLRTLFVYPRYPEELLRLLDLGYNLWSLWDPEASRLLERLDSDLFYRVGRNPVDLLHSLSQERLMELAGDREFLAELDSVWNRYQSAMTPALDPPQIAYFSMEFGLYVLPIYAGGLGILAGDHLKGASDMGLPLIGVGLYYRYGYFQQRIDANGHQEEIYGEAPIPYLPMREWRSPNGDPLFTEIGVRAIAR